MPGFRLVGLPAEPFAPLFDLDDAELVRRDIRRVVADSDFGFPCRVGLADAAVGDTLLLLSWTHLEAASPYHASGPIFVRRGAVQRRAAPDELPPYVTRRLISARAYDAGGMMVDADVCPGSDVAPVIQRMFERADVGFVHLHNAKRGCFSCRVERD